MENIISKGSAVNLLNEFLAVILEAYESTGDVAIALQSVVFSELISKIEETFEELGYEDIKEKILHLARSIDSGETQSFAEIEEEIHAICVEIEKYDFRSSYDIGEGVYLSNNEELSIATEWTSKGKEIQGTPSLSVHQRPRKVTDEFKSATPAFVDDFDETFWEQEIVSEDLQEHNNLPTLTMEDLELPDVALRPLKRVGAHTIEDIVKCIDGRMRCSSLGRKGIKEIVSKLNAHGINYVKICALCETATISEREYHGRYVCDKCGKHVENTYDAGEITLDILPPEESSYIGNENGFHIYINIKNNTTNPVKLVLKECSIYKGTRQYSSNYNLSGYEFIDGYVFPETTRTFAKIWITDNWSSKNICYYDYLTIVFEESDRGTIYYFKFNYSNKENEWIFTDYYKID